MGELLAGGTGVPFTAAAVAAAGFLVLAAVDIRTGLIHGKVVVGLGALVVGALGHDGVSATQVITAALAAATAFGFYLTGWFAGGFGGGDVKAAPLLALPFGASSLALGLGVVLLALGAHLLLTYTIRPHRDDALPHAPAMAIAAAVGAAALLAGTG
ncbi:prepilin peptidase [Leifsonia sp. NPDC014704]|uniref:Prepilin type IV endopeptidase peptidase domain-containing protein n=1 Tax=Leifsonia virtsii TaxID=3035915 RepID=A0ABT8J4T3_9MICO|nr:prepilin peptidase [Leifsonia virtsii]MDN4599279.1 hypothetical protein [Leifsonia virtsii]